MGNDKNYLFDENASFDAKVILGVVYMYNRSNVLFCLTNFLQSAAISVIEFSYFDRMWFQRGEFF